jgi:hypothetical protein
MAALKSSFPAQNMRRPPAQRKFLHRLYSLIKKLFDKAKRLYYNVLQSYDEEK